MNTSHKDLPWDTVDWSRHNVDIAADLGCSHSTVSKYRHSKGPGRARKLIPWHTVTGWAEKNNGVIAKELGCPLSYVATWRHNHNLPYAGRTPGSGLWKKIPLATV